MKKLKVEQSDFCTMQKCALFAGMNSNEMGESLSLLKGTVRTYGKGEFVHGAGEVFSCFGLVLAGCVDVFLDDIEGNRTMMAHVGAGSTFGESLCLLQQKDTGVYALAGENTRVLWLRVSDLLEMGADSERGELTLRLLRMLAKRTLQMNNRIQILSKLTLREKLVTYFTFLSKEKNSRRVEISLNREDLATYLGTNRSALCRELSKMQRDGLIAYRKNRFLLKFGYDTDS